MSRVAISSSNSKVLTFFCPSSGKFILPCFSIPNCSLSSRMVHLMAPIPRGPNWKQSTNYIIQFIVPTYSFSLDSTNHNAMQPYESELITPSSSSLFLALAHAVDIIEPLTFPTGGGFKPLTQRCTFLLRGAKPPGNHKWNQSLCITWYRIVR